jgi:hypothetical protein
MSDILLFQVMMDNMNFIVTRGIQDIPVPPCLQGWEYCGIKACTKADGNCGVCLEVSRKLFLVISCNLHVVNASRWMNLADICALYGMGHEVVPASCYSRCHRILPASDSGKRPQEVDLIYWMFTTRIH